MNAEVTNYATLENGTQPQLSFTENYSYYFVPAPKNTTQCLINLFISNKYSTQKIFEFKNHFEQKYK